MEEGKIMLEIRCRETGKDKLMFYSKCKYCVHELITSDYRIIWCIPFFGLRLYRFEIICPECGMPKKESYWLRDYNNV